jgi:hypothetical protein
MMTIAYLLYIYFFCVQERVGHSFASIAHYVFLRDVLSRIPRKTKKPWCMGPYARVDFNLNLCPLQSRLQHIYHGQPYARVDLNPMQ